MTNDLKSTASAGQLEQPVMRFNSDFELYERGWYLRGDALEKILNWIDAYPVDVFPEMTGDDWNRAAGVLNGAGLSLDRVSASNIRYVITQLRLLVEEGLAV